MQTKTKNIIAITLLLSIVLILNKFLNNTYFSTSAEELIPVVIIFVLICVVMMLIPTVFRIAKKKRMEHKKGVIICLLNSVIISLIGIIPNAISLWNMKKYNTKAMSIDPTVFTKEVIALLVMLGIIYFCVNNLFYVDNKHGN